jgi:LysM repeat protein
MSFMIRKFIYLGIAVGFSLFLSSCATAPIQPIPPVPPPIVVPVHRQDILHIVAPGETVWRISKMYDVPMENILLVNRLENNEKLEKGQRLFVPSAAPIVPVITLYPSGKWKYIIIHHSATDKGNSLDFDKYHSSKGWEGVGYDFVIDNGSKEKYDGQIEVSPRWLKQQDGAHCKADDMNLKGIGICLVGNFNRERVSQKQLDALVYLVNTLRNYYKIPLKNILGHRDVKGATTECPGKYFPWKEFKDRLNALNKR